MVKRKDTNRVIFHHSLSRDVSASVMKVWHVNERGWEDIGYHFVIRDDGRIEGGRPQEYIGAHAKGNNDDSIGVCLTGDFSKAPPSDAQISSACALYYSLCKQYKKDLGIGFHRLTPDPCPGLLLDRKVFRERLQDALRREPPPPVQEKKKMTIRELLIDILESILRWLKRG